MTREGKIKDQGRKREKGKQIERAKPRENIMRKERERLERTRARISCNRRVTAKTNWTLMKRNKALIGKTLFLVFAKKIFPYILLLRKKKYVQQV